MIQPVRLRHILHNTFPSHRIQRRLFLTMQCMSQSNKTNVLVTETAADGAENGAKTKPQTPAISPIPCTAADAIPLAINELRAERVIALPTDTIYGLACCANSESAIRRLYAIKGREQTKAVAICLARIADVRHWGHADHLPDDLLQRLLPGPVTIVLRKREEHLRNAYLNPGFAKIAIRVPDSEFIRRLCGAYGLPLALTSANRSAAQSTLAVHEFAELWPSLAAVFDGGAIQEGLTAEQRAGSTIVDLSEARMCEVVRMGIAAEETLHVIQSFGFRVA